MSLPSRLNALSRDQLIALVGRLVARHPDLEDLVDLPLPGEPQRADGAGVRRQVAYILQTMGDDWRASFRAQRELDPIVDLGDGYRRQGQLDDARTVYRAVIDAILPQYEQIRDEESEIAHIVGDCLTGIGECIAATADDGVRERLLRDAFDVFRWDSMDHGSYGMGEPAEAVLLTRSTAAERIRIAEWIREALPPGSTWGRRRGGEAILRLIGERLDDVAREALYAQATMEQERLGLLLEQGRKREAVDLVRSSASGALHELALRLANVGLGAEAEEAVNHHRELLEVDAHPLRAWLAARGRLDERTLEELVWTLRRFVHSGNVGDWKKVRTRAEAMGRLPQVIPHALAAVATERSSFQASRARVLGAAGLFAEAEAVLARLPEGAWKQAALDVAANAEETQPALAIALYTRAAESLRTRGTTSARKELKDLETRIKALRAR